MKAKHDKDQAFLELLCDIAEDCNYETRVYSGRGMYGEQCIGLILEDSSQIAALAYNIGLADSEDEIAASHIDRLRTDSMGTDIIAYFPSVKVKGDEEADAA